MITPDQIEELREAAKACVNSRCDVFCGNTTPPNVILALFDERDRYREALEEISKDQDYTQSLSTGIKYYHDTWAAERAREALAGEKESK